MVAEGVVAMVAGMVATEEAMEDRRVAMVEAMVPHLVEVMGAAMVVRQMHTEVVRLAAMLDMEPHKPVAMEHHRVPMEANRLLMEEQVRTVPRRLLPPTRSTQVMVPEPNESQVAVVGCLQNTDGIIC